MKFALSMFAQAIPNAAVPADVAFSRCNIDSRKIEAGDLFVALRGEYADGHDFIADAQQKGAVAALVERRIANITIPQVIVPDVKLALGQFATWWRNQFHPKVASVTGSFGKTTVKEMLATIARLHGATLANVGNVNSDIGVPLVMLELTTEHQYAIFELGANHPGEIAYTTRMVRPEVATITAVGAAHLAGFGRTLADIARAKAEIFEGLVPGGIAILNADDAFFNEWRTHCAARQCTLLTFSVKQTADVQGRCVKLNEIGCAVAHIKTPQGDLEVQLSLPGEHQVQNATIATALALSLGIPIKFIQQGLASVQPVKGRLNIRKGMGDIRVIDDTYNASPTAVKAALEVLKQFATPRIAVLADMLELGDTSPQFHQEIGSYAKELNIDALYVLGEYSRHTAEAFGKPAYHFTSQQELISALQTQIPVGATVLVKGSRGMRMEHVVSALCG